MYNKQLTGDGSTSKHSLDSGVGQSVVEVKRVCTCERSRHVHFITFGSGGDTWLENVQGATE